MPPITHTPLTIECACGGLRFLTRLLFDHVLIAVATCTWCDAPDEDEYPFEEDWT